MRKNATTAPVRKDAPQGYGVALSTQTTAINVAPAEIRTPSPSPTHSTPDVGAYEDDTSGGYFGAQDPDDFSFASDWSPSSKRGRRDSVGSESPPVRKAVKLEGSKGRTKARHYDNEVQEVLATAIRYFRCFLSCEDPFPDHVTEISWAKDAWREACQAHKIKMEHDVEILTLVSIVAIPHLACDDRHVADNRARKPPPW